MTRTITLTDEQYAFQAEIAADGATPDALVARWVDRLCELSQLPFQTEEQFSEWMHLIPPAPEPLFDSSQPEDEDADV